MFSEEVERALLIALEAHDGQYRKGDQAPPYVVHPLHVGLMLSALGASEEVIQAGLLHDVVEDSDWTLERLEQEFGSEVAGLVAEVTEDKSKGWRERKEAGIEAVAGLSSHAAMIKGCDHLHNLRTLHLALAGADQPASMWDRFKGGREGTLEIAARFVDQLGKRVPAELTEALREALADLEGSPPG